MKSRIVTFEKLSSSLHFISIDLDTRELTRKYESLGAIKMNDLLSRKKEEPRLSFTYKIYVPEQSIISRRVAVTNEIQLIPASYQPPEQEDVVDVQFDASVLEADKWDYLVAAAICLC